MRIDLQTWKRVLICSRYASCQMRLGAYFFLCFRFGTCLDVRIALGIFMRDMPPGLGLVLGPLEFPFPFNAARMYGMGLFVMECFCLRYSSTGTCA